MDFVGISALTCVSVKFLGVPLDFVRFRLVLVYPAISQGEEDLHEVGTGLPDIILRRFSSKVTDVEDATAIKCGLDGGATEALTEVF